MPRVASAGIAKRNQFAKSMGENVYFLFMDPLWKLCLPLCVLPHAFWMTYSHFRHAFVIILLSVAYTGDTIGTNTSISSRDHSGAVYGDS